MTAIHGEQPEGYHGVHVDCGTCTVRGRACSDCVISVLLGVPEDDPVDLAAEERSALATLAESGLLPPLRLVRPVTARTPETGDPTDDQSDDPTDDQTDYQTGEQTEEDMFGP